MSTEDDLRHMGQAAAALVGVAAARAKQVAEQLLGNRDRGREEFKRRGDSFVEEGRHAAADVVGALRREASVILHDLEHLEQTLRAREGAEAGGTATGTSTGSSTGTTAVLTGPQPAKRAPAKRSAAGPGGEKPAARTTKAASTSKSAATKATKANAEKDAAPGAKAAGGRKAASPRKTTGGTSRPSSEGQG